jgi:hypothetical protein
MQTHLGHSTPAIILALERDQAAGEQLASPSSERPKHEQGLAANSLKRFEVARSKRTSC